METRLNTCNKPLLAAFLYAQFEQAEKIQTHRAHIWNLYHASLHDWANAHGVQMPYIPDYCEQPYHMFYMLLPDLDVRAKFISYLRERNIYSVFHYLPLHLSDMGRRFGGKDGDLPVTESISDRLAGPPFHNGLAGDEQEQVIDAVCGFPF